jgi:AraC-like DNA-binding protein
MQRDMDFVLRPAVQAIFDHMAALNGARIAFYTPDGAELSVGQARGSCAYCRRLRRGLGYEAACQALDRRRQREAAERGRLVAYECHGGMTEAIIPVHIAGRLMGFVMVGQFRCRTRPPAAVLEKARAAGVVRALETAFARAPRYSRAQVQHLVGLLDVLVQFIADHHLVGVEEALLPLLARLREQPEERLALPHAATLAGCSPATLNRRFKRKFGRSFRAVKTELAMQRADELFREAPELRIGEVADRLGFDDPLYFSRLYRRHRGTSPRDAKRVARHSGT